MNKNIKLTKGLILKNISNNQEFYNGLSYEGLCIIRDFSIPIFVYNLLPGEVADIKITYYSKKCCFAEIINLLKYSDKRKELSINKSLLYESGSAPLLCLDYEDQLKFKQNIINNLFERNLDFKAINEIIPSVRQYGYRNKISIQIEYKNNNINLGFYKKYSHILVKQEELLLANKCINNFYKEVLLNPSNEYNLRLNQCIFSNFPTKIVLRSSNYEENKIEIILILKNKSDKKILQSLEELNRLNKNYLFTIYESNKNNWINLLDHNGVIYKINDYLFSIKNYSFYQVNEEIMKLIYEEINNQIANKNLNILDAFSGVGTIGTFLSNKANKIYCVEINKEATRLAKLNLVKNKINNIEIINDDANKWINKNNLDIDIVIFDPPRQGLSKQSIESVINNNIKKIIYLSCDPKTLVRDLKDLIKNGYRLKKVQPYDMFPQTHHIETLVLLEKNQ